MENFKLQRIDKSLISAHSELKPNDICLFFGEYVSHKGYQHGPMNQLIFNLKKEIQKKDKKDWHYKQEALEQIASMLISEPDWDKLKTFTWVPIPPSKKSTHQDYDPRLLNILDKIKETNSKLDVRELLIAKTDRKPAHLDGKRLTKGEHVQNLAVVEKLIKPATKKIIIFDDVIYTGSTFKAAQEILRSQFPDAYIIGIFIARAVGYSV